MSAPERIPYAPSGSETSTDLPPDEAFAPVGRDVDHTPDLPRYVPARAYAVPEILLRARDPSGLALAYWLTLARLGHCRGGTTTTDKQAAGLLRVTPLRIARARAVLIDCDVIHTGTRGRAVLRRAKHDPDGFVSLSYLVVDELWAGSITPAAARQLALVIDKRAERGAGAGCALTAAELAKGTPGPDGQLRGGLGVRVDSIPGNDRQLVAAGLLRIDTGPGVGKIRVPLHTHPVTRRVSATARYAMAARRRAWGLPRPGTRYPQVAPAKVSPLPTPLPNRDQPSLPNRDQSGRVGVVKPLAAPQIHADRGGTAFNDQELTTPWGGQAPWDVEGAVWINHQNRFTDIRSAQ